VRARCAAALVACGVATGCSATNARASGGAGEPAFARAGAILEGFDPWDPGAGWRLGDRLLFGVALQDGATAREMYVLLEVAGRPGRAEVFAKVSARKGGRVVVGSSSVTTGFTATITRGDGSVWTVKSDPISVGVGLHDDAGDLLSSTYTSAPERFLREGFFDACERASASGALSADDETQATNALWALVASIRSTPDVEEVRRAIVDAVVDAPGLLSVVGHLGVNVDVEPHLERSEPASFAWGAEPVSIRRFPVTVSANGSPAMALDVAVARSEGPARLSAGIVAFEGRRPSDPRRRFAVRLLAARRGAADATREAEATDDAMRRAAESRGSP